MKEKFELIISINVHEKPDYLVNQINNINEFVSINKKIILNCNDYMYECLKDLNIANTIINPVPLNKKHRHGTLTQGIISNMRLAYDNFDFEYFLVMSSREFFYNHLNSVSEILNHDANSIGYINTKRKDYESGDWAFWFLKETCKFFKYLKDNNMFFTYSAHEGVCFTKESCQYILNFVSQNPEITSFVFNEDFNYEEFYCQSLSVNSNTGTFYYIGNGCCTEHYPVSPDKLTYKKRR